MKRYLKLYRVFLACAIKSKLVYKKDTIISIISFFISDTCQLLSLYLIIKNIPSLNGWGMYELAFMYGFSMFPKALDHFFTDALWMIGYFYVKTGELDRMLIRPVNPLFHAVAEVFQPAAMGELIMGIGLMIISIPKVHIIYSFGNIVLLLVAVIFGAVIFSALKLITCSVALWTKVSGQLVQIVYNMNDFAKYPVSIYNKAFRFVLSYIIPFALFISVPVEIFFKGNYNPWIVSIEIILVSVVLTTIGMLIWNKGIKKYESSGT